MKTTLRKEIEERVKKAIKEIYPSLKLPLKIDVSVSPPKMGDYASNAAFLISKYLKKNPLEVAENIKNVLVKQDKELNENIMFSNIEVKGKGFINFFLEDKVILKKLFNFLEAEDIPSVNLGKGRKILIEFVSANPTGPLHIGHGRNAAVGDSISRILEYTGYKVKKEFYVNDAGGQIEELGKSIIYYWKKKTGRVEATEAEKIQYESDYIEKIVEELTADNIYEGNPYKTGVNGAGIVLNWIKKDLETFRVTMDSYVSERREVRKKENLRQIIEKLKDAGLVEEQDGAVVFKAEELGDSKSRVLIKSDGEPTYFVSDIIYHIQKYKRGYDTIINVWGADHHGYLPRLKAGLKALGYDENALKVVFIQMVNLLRDGKPVQMSKRKGEFVSLRELIDLVGNGRAEEGVDSTRFIYLTRHSDSHLDVDINLIKSEDKNNPVFYTQYAHARICSIFREGMKRGLIKGDFVQRFKESLSEFSFSDEEERSLLLSALRFPEIVEDSSFFLEPHRITYFLIDLAKRFHRYYNNHRILLEDETIFIFRLGIAEFIRRVFRSGFALLGVRAREKM